jgi:hypothetical protein
MTDAPPPIYSRVPPPPPVTQGSHTLKRPGAVTFIAVTLLVLAGWDMLALLPMDSYLRLPPVILINNIDSLLAIPCFVVSAIALLQMNAWARAWTIRLLALRFFILVGSLAYSLVVTAGAGPIRSAWITILVSYCIIFAFSVAMTVTFIALLCRADINAVFAQLERKPEVV